MRRLAARPADAPETVRGAMEKALAGHEPQIELLTQSKADAPSGEFVFPLAGLSAYSENRCYLERICALRRNPPL